jgi:hypothetical protein
MNRLLRNLFFALAALSVIFAGLFADNLRLHDDPLWNSKTIWCALAGAFFFIAAGWKFPLKLKFKIFAVLFGLLLVELVLQAAAWLGVLPAVNVKARAPYARVYWTSEGRGNGIRNSLGWYYPEFDLKAARKIAFVGDSQVEAVEVLRTQNQAADLQRLLKRQSPDWSVLGLGNHGTCPAFSIDVLEYAWRHFQPQEAIVAVSMGANVSEAVPELAVVPADQYIYYDLDADGKLVLNPASAPARKMFNDGLEFSSRSLLVTLPQIICSHCMILQLAISLRDNLHKGGRQAELIAHGALPNGFNPASYAVNPSPAARRALQILLAQLQQCKNVCDSHGMKFRLVTVAVFPKIFYDTQRGRDWTTRIGDYDYAGPERAVAAWARANGIPVVSMGETIRRKNLDVEEIRSLYFVGGTGHLTPKGHAFCAQAIYEGFYQTKSN